MVHLLDRHWLLTSTTYGTWLPGDERGFVSPVRNAQGESVLHNQPQTEWDQNLPQLSRFAESRMFANAVWLNSPQANQVLEQFSQTASAKDWLLVAGAVMSNHFHPVVSVPGDPEPSTLLQAFKAYASRRLNGDAGVNARKRWWTQSGSRRKLPDEEAVAAAVRYTWNQHRWLSRFIDPEVPETWTVPIRQ